MSTNLVALQAQAPIVPTGSLTQEQIDLVKRTVAKEATNDELQMFLYLAQKYNLDPFKKEIWFIKRAKKDANGKYDYANADTIIMTSRDGYLKIAQSDPEFEGIKSFVVKEGDHFEIDAMSDQITHKFGAKRGRIIGAWAAAFHKNRKPVICFVDFDEYKGTSPIWNNYPSAMIQKVAEVFVLKRQFGINGLVTQEEINLPEFSPEPSPVTQLAPPEQKQKGQTRSNPHPKAKAIELMKEVGFEWNDLAEYASGLFGRQIKKVISDIQADEWQVLVEQLEDLKQKQEGIPVDAPGAQQEINIPDDDLPF